MPWARYIAMKVLPKLAHLSVEGDELDKGDEEEEEGREEVRAALGRSSSS